MQVNLRVIRQGESLVFSIYIVIGYIVWVLYIMKYRYFVYVIYLRRVVEVGKYFSDKVFVRKLVWGFQFEFENLYKMLSVKVQVRNFGVRNGNFRVYGLFSFVKVGVLG